MLRGGQHGTSSRGHQEVLSGVGLAFTEDGCTDVELRMACRVRADSGKMQGLP